MMLARAAEDVGLGRKDALLTIHDMRFLLERIPVVQRTAAQTVVQAIATGAPIALVMLALLAGIAIKLKIFGGGP